MISIIDDDLLVRESTADLVSSLGHEALIFGSGEQFLASGRLKDTACIITDLHMPGLDGLDLQSLLLADGHRTPIIFITAYPKEAARSRALESRRGGLSDQAVRGERLDQLARDCPETVGEVLTPGTEERSPSAEVFQLIAGGAVMAGLVPPSTSSILL